MEKIPWKPKYNGYEAFIKKGEEKENLKNDNIVVQSKFLKPKTDIWEERALWIFAGIFIVIGILFLSRTTNNKTKDQDYCDGSRNAYCP
jgi:hypothetical protein